MGHGDTLSVVSHFNKVAKAALLVALPPIRCTWKRGQYRIVCGNDYSGKLDKILYFLYDE